MLYLTAYTSESAMQHGRASCIIALDYADARTLVQHLREELKLEREAAIRQNREGSK